MDKFEQIKTNYVMSFKQKQKDLQKAFQEQDIEQLLHLLHKLTGSSGGYGYPRISQTCQIIRQHLVSKEKYDYKIIHGLLDTIYVDFQAELDKIQSNPSSKIKSE
jgi:HPt (histidine-containing phosphotransfer) domain-containing protein